ncbi:MAG: acyl-CoA desaturase [Acidimicrobiia bacterium]
MDSDVLERPGTVGEPEDVPEPLVGCAAAPPARYRQVITAILAFGPPVALAMVIVGIALGHTVPWFAIVLAVIFLAVIGHGVTIGFHRLFTHQSFVARRPLKVLLAVLGSMSFQGSIIGWVADHRRHHRYSDRIGDPHSPQWVGAEPVHGLPGLWHAHLGWTFRGESTSRQHYAPDLLADPDIVLVDKLFVPCCIATLALPFAVGYLWAGNLGGAVAALLFAGVIRVGISHNVTWSVNSVCHRFGRRPFATRDMSTNVSALAVLTMGESWHNNHHAFPKLARHGVDPGQFDTSAVMIRLFERLGWVTNVRWPDPVQLAARRASS